MAVPLRPLDTMKKGVALTIWPRSARFRARFRRWAFLFIHRNRGFSGGAVHFGDLPLTLF